MTCSILPPDANSFNSNAGLKKERSVGLDIIRTLAILFVIGSHFFINTNFNNMAFVGIDMFTLGMLQTLTLANVPLFIMLTGYLNANKKVSRTYFKGMTRVLVSYLVISLIVILVRKYYLGESYSWLQWALKITDFSAIPYAWYIEMFIGLFMLTPFLNILWKGIERKRHKQLLILILFICSALPDFCNRYGVHLMPGYWTKASDILMYYYLGSYVRDYKPMIKTWKGILAVIALCVVNPIASMLLRPGQQMLHIIGGSFGVIVVPLTVILFVLIYQANFGNNWIRGSFASVSVLSLDMYLMSYIFDASLYPLLGRWFGSEEAMVGFAYFLIVPILFLSSWFSAYLKDKISIGIHVILCNRYNPIAWLARFH